MAGILKDKSDGYKCNNSNDATSDGNLRRTSFDYMIEGMNGEGNGKEEENKVIMKTEEGNPRSHQKEGCLVRCGM
jgi:hypothetical protein